MKKDKIKNQPGPEANAAGVPEVSYMTLTLQLLSKEKEKNKAADKKDSADEAEKIRCKICFKEIAPKRFCSGHSSGGGGGSGGAADEASEEKANPGADKSQTKPSKVEETTEEFLGAFESEKLVSEPQFDPEIIADLIAKGLLLVDSDRESMTLTVQLLCEPDVLTEEQQEELKKFMEAILTECNAFKDENSLSSDCMEIVQDGKGNIISLRITMPTLALYDAFIQRLASNLVPLPSLEAQVTKVQNVAPNPLSMEPKPSNKEIPSKREEMESAQENETEKTDEEERAIFNPTPFKMEPW